MPPKQLNVSLQEPPNPATLSKQKAIERFRDGYAWETQTWFSEQSSSSHVKRVTIGLQVGTVITLEVGPTVGNVARVNGVAGVNGVGDVSGVNGLVENGVIVGVNGVVVNGVIVGVNGVIEVVGGGLEGHNWVVVSNVSLIHSKPGRQTIPVHEDGATQTAVASLPSPCTSHTSPC